MNPGAIASAAGNAAGNAASAAGNAASTAASNAAANAASTAGNAAGNAASAAANVPQQPKVGANAPEPGSQSGTAPSIDSNTPPEGGKTNLEKAQDASEKIDQMSGDNKEGGAPTNEDGEGPQPGDKAGTGKQIGEDGQVEDSSTAKTLKAAGRVAARVYGGEAGGQAADMVAKSKLGDKAIGVISDVADKAPGVSQATEALDKAGVADGVNDALDTFEKAKSGDIKGAKESAEKTKKDLKKTKKTLRPFILIGLALAAIPVIAGIAVVAAAAQSLSFESTKSTEDVYQNMYDYEWPEHPENESGEGNGDENPIYDGEYDGEAAQIPKKERMAWLFPEGVPTTEAEMQKYLATTSVTIWTGSGTSTMNLRIHKKLAATYQKIFEEMAAIKFPVDPKCTGGYNWRPMSTNPNKQSYHSYGSVVDLNWTYNPLVYGTGNPYLGSSPYAITQDVVNIWKKYGFYWGGDWTSYQDYMHFTYTNN